MPCFPYWRISAYYFFYFAFIGGFTPYFGLYLQSLSFQAWDIGVVMSQMQLMRLFGPYFWGWLADRCGNRLRIIRLTSMVTLLAFLSLFLARRFEVVLVVLAAQSFFWVASLPLVETLTFDHLRENPLGYSRIRIWGSVGFIAAVLCIGALLDFLGLGALLWGNLLLMLGIVLNTFFVPEVSHSPKVDEGLPISEIIRQPRIKGLFLACFFMSAAHGTLNIFYSIFLTDHGYSKSMVGGLFTLGVLAEIAVFFYMSVLMRRFGLRCLLITCFFAGIVRFILIGFCADSLAILIFAQLMHGLTFGAFHAVSIAAINRWFPGNTRSRGQALYSSISFGAGGLVGGLLSGWAWELLGGELTFALGSFYALAGLAVTFVWVREVHDDPCRSVRP